VPEIKSIKLDVGLFWIMSFLFMSAAVVGIYLRTWVPLWVLTALPLGLFLLQYPEKLFLFLLLSLPLSIEYSFPLGFSSDLPDEPLLLILSLSGGFILLSANHEKQASFLHHPLLLLLAFQLLWTACLLFYSTHPILSAKFAIAKIWFLIPLVLLPQFLLHDRQSFRRIAIVVISATLFTALYTMYRHAGRGFSFVGINPSLSPFFRNHVSYAATLSFGFCLLLVLFVRNRQPWLRRATGILLLVLGIAIFFSYTRGTWLSVALSVLAWGLFCYRRLLQSLVLSGTAVLLGFLILSLNQNYLILKPDFEKTVVHTSLSGHLNSMYKLQEISGSERLYRWIAGVRMIGERPLQGFGPACFYSNYKNYTDSRFKTWVSGNPEKSSVHNYFLLTWIEQGLPGLVLLLLIIGYFFHRCHRLYFSIRDPFYRQLIEMLILIMINILVINFFSDMIETDKVGAVYFLSLGILIWLDKQVQRGQIA